MERWDIHQGDDVYGIDGEKIGTVTAVQPGFVVVERGHFFPTTYYVPAETVATRGDGAVHLAVTTPRPMTSDTCLHLAWQESWPRSPAGMSSPATSFARFLSLKGSIYVRDHAARFGVDRCGGSGAVSGRFAPRTGR